MTGRLLQTVLRQASALAADAGPDAVSDADLLARFAKLRDEPAFAALVRRHGPMVWAVCRHLLPNTSDAEDAFQATFLALVRSAEKIRTATVGAWLHGVAVRAAAKLKRSAVRRKQREERVAGPEADRSVPEGVWDELLAAVHEEVGQLPDSLRTAFVLCDLEGVRQPDAAAQLGWKPGTLTGRLTKARQRLLAQLADRGIAAGAVAIGSVAAGAAVPSALAGKVLNLSTAAANAVPPTIWQLTLEVTPMTVNKTKLIAACVLVASGLGLGVGSALMPDAGAQGPQTPGNELPAPQLPPSPEVVTDLPPPDGRPGQPDAGVRRLGAPAAEPVDAGSADAGGGMMGMMGGAPASAAQRWEYQFDEVPGSVDAFRKLVMKRGQEGWEFAGGVTVRNSSAGPGMPGGPGAGSPDAALPGMPGAARSANATQLVFKRPVKSGSPRPAERGQSMVPAGGMGGMMPGRPSPGERRGSPGRANTPGNPNAMMPGGGMPGMGAPGGMIPPAQASQARGAFQVIPMKHATARQLAETLAQLFPGVTAVADDRTNSLILKADADTVGEIKELIQKLDVAGSESPNIPSLPGTPGTPRR